MGRARALVVGEATPFASSTIVRMKMGAVSLVFSALALAIAGFAVTRESPQTVRAPIRTNRVADLERKVAELTRELESLKAERPRPIERVTVESPSEASHAETGDFGSPSDIPDNEALTVVIDAAVDRKTKRVLDEMRIKENKKPAMDVFASMLDLTPEQRVATERVVVEGQRKVYEILDTPTADGTKLMDDLVEALARGIARGQGWQPDPFKDSGWGRFVARVVGEKIPGTDETYGARIESVKAAMHTSFKRDWSDAQYKEFQAWGVDPTEIQRVPGSPWGAAFGERITDRVRELGAEIPEDR